MGVDNICYKIWTAEIDSEVIFTYNNLISFPLASDNIISTVCHFIYITDTELWDVLRCLAEGETKTLFFPFQQYTQEICLLTPTHFSGRDRERQRETERDRERQSETERETERERAFKRVEKKKRGTEFPFSPLTFTPPSDFLFSKLLHAETEEGEGQTLRTWLN